MAWIKVRVTDDGDGDGDKRFVACYPDPEGRHRSAGTYSSRRAAERAANPEEAKVRDGSWHDHSRGEATFAEYVQTARALVRAEHRRGIAWCRHADCVIGTACPSCALGDARHRQLNWYQVRTSVRRAETMTESTSETPVLGLLASMTADSVEASRSEMRWWGRRSGR
jgi:hypothetical protein